MTAIWNAWQVPDGTGADAPRLILSRPNGFDLEAEYTQSMVFEWDPAKAAANHKKHAVDFSEAMTIFADPLELTIADPDHSEDEQRFLSIGRSTGGRLLVVAYTERAGRTRIINAREASSQERKHYESSNPSRR
jgi:uncharacterized DUF497 family protein